MKRSFCLKLTLLFSILLLSIAPAATSAQDDVNSILTASSAKIAETQSLAFKLDVSGTTHIDPAGSIQLISAEGKLARPNLVDVEFKIKLFGLQTVSIKMITVGDKSWTTDLISGNWGPAPEEFGYDPSTLFDAQEGLGPLMGKIENAELVGEESVDDNDAWHITGTVQQSVIGEITANNMHGDVIALDLWIDKDSSDLLRAQLAEPTDGDIEDPATWTMDLRDQNEPVTIEPPI